MLKNRKIGIVKVEKNVFLLPCLIYFVPLQPQIYGLYPNDTAWQAVFLQVRPWKRAPRLASPYAVNIINI